MKKYFYIDATEAEYMSKKFCVRFICQREVGTKYDFKPEWFSLNNDNCIFYVRADNHRIFEPKDGDLLDSGFLVVNSYAGSSMRDLHITPQEIDHDHARIIYRDGKPFLWPLCEEKNQTRESVGEK